MEPSIPKTIGRYQVLQELATGGMATVYLAQDPDIEDHRVAIKVIREGMDGEEMLERFEREAGSVRKLKHPNIVRIYGLGRQDGRPFIVMEYLEGKTLGEMIREQSTRAAPRMTIARRLGIIEQLCHGLYAAHTRDVVHRDVKPDNVMVLTDENDLVKILDFGIARLGGSNDSQSDKPSQRPLTRAGWIMGTFDYIAPEQIESKPVDGRADMFAVGAVMYELLSYQKPFQTSNPGDLTELGRKILYSQPEPLKNLVPNVDPALVAIVERCLEKDRDKRYPNLDVVCREIAAVRQRIAVEEQRRFQAALARAQRDLTAVLLDSAVQAIGEAIEIDGTNPDALALRQRITAALAERQKAEQEAVARQAIAEATQLFEEGEIDAAIAKLKVVEPPMPMVSEALAAMKSEADRRERTRLERERLERERLERERRERERLERERERIERERSERERLEAEQRQRDEARKAADERRRRETDAALAEHFSEAEKSIGARHWSLANSHLERAAEINAGDSRVATLRLRIDEGLAAQRADAQRRLNAGARTVLIQPDLVKPSRDWTKPIAALVGVAAVVLVAVVLWSRSSGSSEPAVAATTADSQPPAVQKVEPPPPPATPISPETTSTVPAAVERPPETAVAKPQTSLPQRGAERPNRTGAVERPPARQPPPLAPVTTSVPIRNAPPPPPEPPQARREEQAKQALAAATRADAAGDFTTAMQQFDLARQLDPSMAAVVDQLQSRARERMRAEATDALRRARQYDALDRVADAVKWYEQAARLLPADAPERINAEARLKILKARQ